MNILLTQRPVNFFSEQWVFHGVFLPERGAILQQFVSGEGAGLEGGPCGTRSLFLYPAERKESLGIQHQCLYQPSELHTAGKNRFIINSNCNEDLQSGGELHYFIVSEFN